MKLAAALVAVVVALAGSTAHADDPYAPVTMPVPGPEPRGAPEVFVGAYIPVMPGMQTGGVGISGDAGIHVTAGWVIGAHAEVAAIGAGDVTKPAPGTSGHPIGHELGAFGTLEYTPWRSLRQRLVFGFGMGVSVVSPGRFAQSNQDITSTETALGYRAELALELDKRFRISLAATIHMGGLIVEDRTTGSDDDREASTLALAVSYNLLAR